MPGWDGAISSAWKRWLAQNLAARLLAQAWTLPFIADAVKAALIGAHPRTRAALTVRVFALGENRAPPSQPALVDFLLRSAFFDPKLSGPSTAALDSPLFQPLAALAGLAVPVLATVGDLASWLGLTADELDWFSGEKEGRHRPRAPTLLHYRHLVTRKHDGAPRLLEAPKPRLKAIQRRILREILAHVPVHERAHGFVPGRSCLTGAQIHAGEGVVVTFDLVQFFPSIAGARVHGLFRALGYPWPVARRLAGLCTTVTPLDVLDGLPSTLHDAARLRAVYRARHLPQGSPTSPALANLLAWRLDRRLDGAARAANAAYTRYADDLAFSGDDAFARALPRFRRLVATIAAEEGFTLNTAKHRVMPCHRRQHVTGLIVNQHLNVGRAERDLLKAILHRCVRDGPAQQNRASVPDFRRHLEGRIGWVAQVNPAQGRRLWALFDRIAWDETGEGR